MNLGRRNAPGLITPNLPIDQVHAAMRSITPAIKNASEAKSYLTTKAWALPGEEISLHTLARILFATLTENSKIPLQAANPIVAVAYLITEEIESGIKLDISDAISKHLLDSLLPIAADFEAKLDQHTQSVNEAIKSYTEMTERIQLTQDKLDNAAKKANSNAKSYSQAVTSNPPLPSPPAATHSHIQIRNREEIKKRQVLINFTKTTDLALDNFDEHMLSRKALEALNTTWVAAPEPKPAHPKLKAATLMRNGGLLLELDSSASADWLRETTPRDSFLSNLGSGANIKDRSYQVIVQFVPIQFNPEDTEQLRQYESFNGLAPHSILKAEWIKPIKDRKPTQKVATMRVYHRTAESANVILKEGASILSKRVIPKKPKKEPIRCLRCQRFGHERRACQATAPRCGKCADQHETDSCPADRFNPKCANCSGHHPSYDRDCPRFWDKCHQIDGRCPENKLAFYPTDEPWSWVTFDQAIQHEQPNDPPHPSNHNPPPNFYTSGPNNTPLGRPSPNNRQSQFHPPPPQ